MSVYMRNMEHKCTWLTPPTTSRRSLMMMEEVEHLGKVMGANLSHFFLWGWKASTVSRAEGSWPGEQTQSKDIIPKALNVPSCFISVYWLANGVFLIWMQHECIINWHCSQSLQCIPLTKSSSYHHPSTQESSSKVSSLCFHRHRLLRLQPHS